MSGHSKWSTIKHKKAAQDAKRGGIFTKMASAITVAVKKGGGVGDPDMNFALRLAVDKARSVNMPKDNIERAIKRGMGKGETGDLEEMVLEGYGPNGVAIVIEAVTDNRNRTVAEVKNILEKSGGRIGEPGSVMYQFDMVGEVRVPKDLSEEMQLELIDKGVTEVEKEGGESRIVCGSRDLGAVVSYLKSKGLTGIDYGVIYQPKLVNKIESGSEKLDQLLSTLDDHADVQEVYVNAIW